MVIRASNVKTCMDSFLKSAPNNNLKRWGDFLGTADDGVLRTGQSLAQIISLSASQRGDHATAQKSMDVADAFSFGRDITGLGRAACVVHTWGTGQAIWQTNEDEKSGRITGWKKVKVDDHGRPFRVNGEYVLAAPGDKYMYLKHDWMTIAMNVFTVAARVLGSILFFHNVGAANLGKHSKTMGGVVVGLWGIVLSINLAQSVRDHVNETDRKKILESAGNAVLAALDLLGLFGDLLKYSAPKDNLAILITFSVINFVAGAGTTIKDAMKYS